MRRQQLIAIALAASASCTDRKTSGGADSDLTRDLALANQPISQPEFRDTALSAPVATQPKPKTHTPTTRPSAPARKASSQVVTRPQTAQPQRTEDVAIAPA